MSTKATIDIPRVDHIGVRVRDLDRAMKFYAMLGFTIHAKATNDAVAVVKNEHDVELNLVYNIIEMETVERAVKPFSALECFIRAPSVILDVCDTPSIVATDTTWRRLPPINHL